MKRYLLGGVVASLLAGLLLATLPVGAQSGDMTVGLSACWDMEEGSGTRVDSWSTNHLTDNNTVTSATGKVGDAAQLVAANSEYFSIASNSSLQASTNLSLASWVYLDSKGSINPIISKWFVSAEYALLYVGEIDRFVFQVRNAANSTTTVVNADALGSPGLSTWYLVIGWYDNTANTLNIQVNNGSVNSTSGFTGINSATENFYVGRYPAGDWFYGDGRMDTTIVAETVWSGTQRTWLYNGNSGRSCNDLITSSYTPTPTSTTAPTATPTATPTPTRQYLVATRPADPQFANLTTFSYDLIEGLFIFWIVPGIGLGAAVVFVTFRLVKERVA